MEVARRWERVRESSQGSRLTHTHVHMHVHSGKQHFGKTAFQENSKESPQSHQVPAPSWYAEGCSQSPEQPLSLQLINDDKHR